MLIGYAFNCSICLKLELRSDELKCLRLLFSPALSLFIIMLMMARAPDLFVLLSTVEFFFIDRCLFVTSSDSIAFVFNISRLLRAECSSFVGEVDRLLLKLMFSGSPP